MRFERAHVRSLGRKIRSLRETRKWSLRRLSSISGVSVAALQKIEAGPSNPSLLTVIAIIDALGASVDQLISDARQPDQPATIVRGTLKPKTNGGTLLSSGLAERRMDCRAVNLTARQKRDDAIIGNPVFGYVLEGDLRLTFADGKSIALSTGDSFHTAADTAPEWRNPLSRRCLVLCINDIGETKGSSRRRGRR
jgi:transcriptional regulator with XRE-family HTH domain